MPWVIIMLGYFLGSIPTAYLAGHLQHGVGIRQIGDKNMGAGIAAIIGHNWPAFIGFRGDRGVSTTIGVLVTVLTQPMLISGPPTIIAFLVSRNVTLALPSPP
ncbi:glycerol-3-phosphate acyltransferase [Chloroflexota bacterium]